jgi:hypothetical protein
MVQRLIPEVGFPWAMRITAFVVLFMLIIANLTITSRLPPRASPFDVMEFVDPLKEFPFVLVCFGCFIFFLGKNQWVKGFSATAPIAVATRDALRLPEPTLMFLTLLTLSPII